MSFWGITTYFNPSKYAARFKNYKEFRKSSKEQKLKLLTVELAIKNQPFVLTNNDADILIQVRSESVMWHKERLLNLALEKLPVECTKICWLDCDLIFLNGQWVNETKKLLDKYQLVQPFSTIMLADKKGRVNHEAFGFGYFCKISPNDSPIKSTATWGYGWAANRKKIEEMGGFYDKNIVGGGDNIVKFSFGFSELKKELFSDAHLQDLHEYFERTKNNRLQLKHISSTSGAVKHLWHGDRSDRGYKQRNFILKDNNFDPKKHLTINNDGCFEFTEEAKNLLENKIIEYFASRKEDGKN